MTVGVHAEGIFPVVVGQVNNIKCRALIDSGAGSSYASAKLIDALQTEPSDIKHQRIDMLMTSQTKRIEIHRATISALDGSHVMKVKLNKVDRPELLTTSNPQYEKLVREYKHLNSVKMDDVESKARLPIHLVLGSGEYARIKTRTKPLVGNEGDPIAELTKLGWIIMSPGVEVDQNMMLLTTTTNSQNDLERLCRLDVLGLEDTPEKNPLLVYDQFREDLSRDDEGWYETGLPWKTYHPELPSYERGSLRRLNSLMKRLERSGMYEEYNAIINEQLQKA